MIINYYTDYSKQEQKDEFTFKNGTLYYKDVPFYGNLKIKLIAIGYKITTFKKYKEGEKNGILISLYEKL